MTVVKIIKIDPRTCQDEVVAETPRRSISFWAVVPHVCLLVVDGPVRLSPLGERRPRTHPPPSSAAQRCEKKKTREGRPPPRRRLSSSKRRKVYNFL